MNKIYKVVWNTVRNCYVVGSELISSKSGRHSTSNGKSSSLKVTLTVLALCGMTALGSGVAPAYAANAGTAVESQYVAVHVNDSNNSRRNYRTFDGHSYHKETVSGETYWVRDGYTIKYEANKRYPNAQKDNIIKAYKTSSYTTASDEGLLKSNQIMIESAGISTLTGVDLDNVSGGTYVGATNSGSTSTPSSFNYMIKDDNGTYVDAGNTNFSKRFKAATKNTDGTYSYNGEVIANDNLYVVNEQVGVFLTSSGKVYTGKVFGANNEVLMTTKSDEGTMYSYWGADTPDPNTKLADMTIGQFNQALEKVNNNSKAVAGDTIKEIKTTAKTDGGTIDLVRRGQYNSATGQYEGEHKVGSGITITSRGGTNGEDVKINFSNGTPGFDVAAGSKVEAVKATESATDITGLKINGKTYNIKTGTTEVKGGTNIASVTKTPGSNGNDVYTVNAKGTTVSTDDNFVLDTTTNAENNVTNYGLSLANRITIGKGENSRPIVIDGNKGEITGLTNTGLNATDFAKVGRAATEEQLKEVDSKATAAKTTVIAGKNIEVKGQSGANGSAYTVALADDVSLGNNAAIQLKGSDGSISATSDTSSLNFNDKGLSLSNGKDSTVINGGTITVNGGDSVISGTQATFGKIKLNDESGSTITGLTNTTTDYTGFATAGRAATEEQLKEVAGQAGKAIETAGQGWNLTTNGKDASKTNIKPGDKVDFSSKNDNLLISNDGADLSFSLSNNLDLTENDSKKGSVKVGENTTLTDGLLRVGTDVSLTASALNVGKSSLTTSALTVGGSTYINSSGINANGNRITGVAAGIEPMDAVNVSQLYKTNQAVNNNTENINSLSHSLNKLDSRINRVGAGAAALAALHPLDFDPDNKWDFAAGYGNYAGANAVAIGTYYRPNENTMFSIGGSFGGGENMINAGVSFKLGSGGSGITTSKTVMAKKIKEQDELLKAQDAKMKEQDEKIAKLEALVAQQGEMIQQALGKK